MAAPKMPREYKLSERPGFSPRITFRLPDDIVSKLVSHRERTGEPYAAFIRRAVLELLDREHSDNGRQVLAP